MPLIVVIYIKIVQIKLELNQPLGACYRRSLWSAVARDTAGEFKSAKWLI
jgi:hypothetical protein